MQKMQLNIMYEGKKRMDLLILFITGILLFVLSVMDLKDKKVNIWMVAGLGLMCVLGVVFNQNTNRFACAGGLALGLGAVGFSFISNEQIGMGDGVIIACLGLLLGFRNVLIVVCMASFFMALLSVVILILKMGNRNTKLPFVPAIFLSYCVCMVAQI